MSDLVSPQMESPEQDAQALLPDGIGLTVENVRALLAKQHDTIVPKDDPMLMVVTLMNAFLTEIERLQARHEKGLSRLMTDKTDTYVAGVQSATDSLSESLSQASVESVRKIFAAHAAHLDAFKAYFTWLVLLVLITGAVNVLVFIFMALKR